MNRLVRALEKESFILAEGSIIELIKRNYSIEIDQYISNSALVLDSEKREILKSVYREYLEIAINKKLPIMLLTPTWKASSRNASLYGIDYLDLNKKCVDLLFELRNEYENYSDKIIIGGLIGPIGDAYDYKTALSAEESYEEHSKQINALNSLGVDFLIAQTMPALSESLGIAKACAETGAQYAISFIIRQNGCLLDGVPLKEAISKIDSSSMVEPLFYGVNCVHPRIFAGAINKDASSSRIIALQANASPLSPEELNNSKLLQSQEPRAFALELFQTAIDSKLKIIGGCCGAFPKHIEFLAGLIEELKTNKLITDIFKIPNLM